MNKRKKYLALKWRIAFTVIPIISIISICISALTYVLMKSSIAGSEEVLATTVSVDELVLKTKEKSDRIRKGTEALHIASADLNKEMQYFSV